MTFVLHLRSTATLTRATARNCAVKSHVPSCTMARALAQSIPAAAARSAAVVCAILRRNILAVAARAPIWNCRMDASLGGHSRIVVVVVRALVSREQSLARDAPAVAVKASLRGCLLICKAAGVAKPEWGATTRPGPGKARKSVVSV